VVAAGVERTAESPGERGVGVNLGSRSPFTNELGHPLVAVDRSSGRHHPGELVEEE
jgi:hypothetical protein